MKTLISSVTLILALSSANISAQGTLNFANFAEGVNAPVTNWDGTSLMGSQFGANLYWAPGIVTDSTMLIDSQSPTWFSTNGYFFGGTRTIPGVNGGSVVTVQVRIGDNTGCPPWVWDCISPIVQHGESELIQVTLSSPAGQPVNLVGLKPFGFSAPVTRSAPHVTVNALNDTLTFSWLPSLVMTNVTLQQNADLQTTNWVTVPGLPVLTGSQFQLTVPKPNGMMFYRLVQ